MAKKYDLVIVGGGPAGLMAGRIAAENGLKVVILERKTDICKVRRLMAEFLPSMNIPLASSHCLMNGINGSVFP